MSSHTLMCAIKRLWFGTQIKLGFSVFCCDLQLRANVHVIAPNVAFILLSAELQNKAKVKKTKKTDVMKVVF